MSVVVSAFAVTQGANPFVLAALFSIAATATYTICASQRVVAQTQRDAYELGREHERRRALAESVTPLR